MKRTTRALLCVLMIFLLTSACLIPASANSAVRYWEGSTAYGVMVGEGQCPIQVLHETLTFDIPHFPDYVSANESEQYEAKVTADYTLYNPSNEDVTVKLAFPFGQGPNYHFSSIEDGAEGYGVSLNGQSVEVQLRHTYLWGQFELYNDLPKLRDGYAEDVFYTPELPVTHYVYSLRKTNVTKAVQAYAELLIESDLGEKTKIFVPDSISPRDGNGVHIQVDVPYNVKQQILDVYVIGEPLEVMPEWKLGFRDLSPSFQAEFTLLSTTEMTYYDLTMLEYEENGSVMEKDWYNAITDAFIEGKRDFGVASSYHGTLDMTGWLMQWYEYEITVPAGKTVQNSVTAPLFPSIDRGYEPSVYLYNYLLSPATTWASFGTLDVIINTPYYLVNDTASFEKVEGGYKKHFDSLPAGELSFSLSASEKPKHTFPYQTAFLILLGIALAVVIFLIVILVLIVRAIIRLFRR